MDSMPAIKTAPDEPFGGGDGDAPRPVADRFSWLEASAGGWQFGEQGVLEDIFATIGTTNCYAVEFGAGDGGSLPLTCERLVKSGWDALLIEGDPLSCIHLENRYGRGVTVVNRMVGLSGEHRIDAIMAEHKAPANPDLMVIDVDSFDWHILDSIREHRPRVIVCEHMDLECPSPQADADAVPAPEDCGKDTGGGFVLQASARQVVKLGEDKGYVRVFTTRVNTILVDAKDAEKLARDRVCLNVGAGGKHVPGYVPIDIKDGVDASKLPYADGSVDSIYASHLLEHFDYGEQTKEVLAEWRRVLRPGGTLFVSVPDVEKYQSQRTRENSFIYDRMLLGGHVDEKDRHGSVYDEATLSRTLHAAGFGHVQPFKPFADDCSKLPISLNLRATKRSFRRLAAPRVCIVLSQPRFAFTGHEHCLIRLAQAMKFDIEFSKGAFWDRDIEISTMSAINKYQPDILLYSDYDSIFDVSDVMKIISTVNNDPDIAACGAVQMERHGDRPLVYDPKIDYVGEITRVNFHHFGLTAVRREVFEELPHPWFMSFPGSNGEWTMWNRSDADITFWRMLREYGFKVVQRNDVVIGHIINAIKWPSVKGYGVTLQPEDAYRVNGKPPHAGFNQDIFRARELAAKREDKPGDWSKQDDQMLRGNSKEGSD